MYNVMEVEISFQILLIYTNPCTLSQQAKSHLYVSSFSKPNLNIANYELLSYFEMNCNLTKEPYYFSVQEISSFLSWEVLSCTEHTMYIRKRGHPPEKKDACSFLEYRRRSSYDFPIKHSVYSALW